MESKLIFQIASDIHIEKYFNGFDKLPDKITADNENGNNSPNEDEDIEPKTKEDFPKLLSITDFIDVSAQNLILAGDIGSAYYEEQLTYFLKSCKEKFESVIYIAGNNEYYHRKGFQLKPVKELENTIKQICVDTGVYYLNNSYIETDTHIIFGSTWWSRVNGSPGMNILYEDHIINSDDFNFMHYTSRMSLNKVIEINKTLGKKLVVVTHYCPTKIGTMSGYHKREEFTHLVPYYFSESEQFLNKGCVDVWIYGHTHISRDFIFDTGNINVKGTRIISNADPKKQKFFKRNFTFDV